MLNPVEESKVAAQENDFDKLMREMQEVMGGQPKPTTISKEKAYDSLQKFTL